MIFMFDQIRKGNLNFPEKQAGVAAKPYPDQ